MATIVHTDEDFAKMYVFRTQDEHVLYISNFNEGVATVEITDDHTFDSLARVIFGCFSRKSNFAKAILKAYHCDENMSFKGFAININGKMVNITKENCDIDEIIELIKQAENETKEEAMANSFGQLVEFFTGIPKEVSYVRAIVKIEFKDEASKKSWDEWFGSAKSEKQKEIVGFGDLLARYTQSAMKEGCPFELAVTRSYLKISAMYEKLDDAMKQYAIDKLIECWKYGRELKKWNDSRTKSDLKNLIDEI